MTIAVIPGDGIGPEVTESAISVLYAVGFRPDYATVYVGFERWEKDGVPIADDDIEALRSCDAILKGPTQTTTKYESPVIRIRQALDLYANVRPVKNLPHSDRKFDVVIVRENTEGSYAGKDLLERIEEKYGVRLPTFRNDELGLAVNVRVITREGTERISRFAFDYAEKHGRKGVCCAHKVNVIRETDGLFKDVFYDVSKDYPGIVSSDMNVDACGMELIRRPQDFDVLVMENSYGDILSDVIAALTSIGVLGSMNIGKKNALFEPVHGTAPDIAGTGKANPIAQIRASQYMLEYLGYAMMARKIDEAIERILRERKVVTEDLGGTSTTKELTKQLIENLY